MAAVWVSKTDPTSGQTYYVNAVTKESWWSAPADGADGAWTAKVDPASDKTYYANAVTKESQWHPPAGAPQQVITADSFEAVFSAVGAGGRPRP